MPGYPSVNSSLRQRWVKVFQDLREGKESTTTVHNEAEKIIQIQEEGEPESSKGNVNPTLIESSTKFISNRF